ncbi:MULTISPECIES: hypothetical protein [unclassified Rhizobium]|uniref:hypothetical protein n=1 Tax=unclassified Rhizobium TaxID=2613769 RepID=UPI0016096252|nr:MULTISPECIES: hypothetical protein [unclassified Rhizobium]MBB3297894.1 hypothetical protein [Rhizobium sp. BK112]MBB4177611.1 hypothetical protein [Rhizobium sp. BK109]
MKLVDLTTDLRPWRKGDSVPLPNDVARTLVVNGEAKNMRPFKPGAHAAPQPVERPKGTYLTKGKDA